MDKRLLDPRYEMEHVVLPEFFYHSPAEFFEHAKTKLIPFDCYQFVCTERNKEMQYSKDDFDIVHSLKPGDVKLCAITMPDAEKNFDCPRIFTLSDLEYALYFILEYEHVELPGKKNPNPSDLTLYYITIDGTKEFLTRVSPEDDIETILLDFFRQDL